MNVESFHAPMLDLLLKSIVVLAAAALLQRAFRHASAANRHAMMAAAFLTLLLLPLSKLASPQWTLGLQRNVDSASMILSPPIGNVVPSLSPIEALSVTVEEPRIKRDSVSWPSLALAVWIVGASFLLGRRALISLRLRALVSQSRKFPNERVSALARDIFASRKVTVRMSVRCQVPVAFGIWRPIVLLPVETEQWTNEKIAAALQHEIGHIRRRDCATRLLADGMCAIYWVNPLVWLAARQLRLTQEQACDDLVLAAGATADDYAAYLIETVRNLQGDGTAVRHALAMAQPSTLETRVRAIVEANRDRSPCRTRSAFIGLAFVILAMALSTMAQLGAIEAAAPEANNQENRGPAVEIAAMFIEITWPNTTAAEVGEELSEFLKTATSGGVLSPEEAGGITAEILQKRRGVDLLTSPRLITRSGQRGLIEIGNEIRFAVKWEKDLVTGAWKPSKYKMRRPGPKLDVTPTVTSNGVIELKMIAEIVDFVGFTDLDGDGKTLFRTADADELEDQSNPNAPAAESVPKGHRAEATFSTVNVTTNIELHSGETAVVELRNDDKTRIAGDPMRRRFALVTPLVAEDGSDSTTEPAKPVKSPSDPAGASRDPSVDEITQKEKAPDAGAAGALIIPKLEFKLVTLREAIAFITRASQEVDPAKKGVSVVIFDENKEGLGDRKIDLSLKNVPIFGALNFIALSAQCALIEKDGGFIIRSGAPPLMSLAPATASLSAAWKAAERIVVPEVEFRDATLREALEILWAKSIEVDPAKKGVYLVLEPVLPVELVKINLSLRDVSLADALKQVAAQAGREIEMNDFAIFLQIARKAK